ncbi:MAG: hypothetical protein ACJ76F_04555 [Bacteroidia bacterium]
MAHSVVPHHHHHDDHEMEQASHHHHHDNHDDDDKSLAGNFENYIHPGDNEELYQQPDLKVSFNTMATAYIFTLFIFQLKAVENPPPIVWYHTGDIPVLQHSLFSKGLRAPPTSLA